MRDRLDEATTRLVLAGFQPLTRLNAVAARWRSGCALREARFALGAQWPHLRGALGPPQVFVKGLMVTFPRQLLPNGFKVALHVLITTAFPVIHDQRDLSRTALANGANVGGVD
jgi:hypothetical protein